MKNFLIYVTLGVTIICLTLLSLILVEVYTGLPTVKRDYTGLVSDLRSGAKAWSESSEQIAKATKENQSLILAMREVPENLNRASLNLNFLLKETRDFISNSNAAVTDVRPLLTKTVLDTDNAINELSNKLNSTADAATNTLDTATGEIKQLGDSAELIMIDTNTAVKDLDKTINTVNTTVGDPNIKKSLENIEQMTFHGNKILEITYKRLSNAVSSIMTYFTKIAINVWEFIKAVN